MRNEGFTLVELIVVIGILAILAAIGFLSLSGYSNDADDARVRTSMRSLFTSISSESTLQSTSPRRYIVHNTGAALVGASYNGSNLVPGSFGVTGANYSAGKPDFSTLRIDSKGFKNADGTNFIIAAFDFIESSVSGRTRNIPYFQVAGSVQNPASTAIVGNYPVSSLPSASSSGLVASSYGSSIPLTEGMRYPDMSGGPSDSYFANVVALLHLDTNFSDSKGHSFIPQGSTSITSAQSVFGGGGVQSSGGLLSATSPDWDMGSGDFTIEFWYRPSLTNHNDSIFALGDNNGAAIPAPGFAQMAVYANNASASEMSLYFGVSKSDLSGFHNGGESLGNVTKGVWHHIAIARSGGIVRGFVNGVHISTTNVTGALGFPAGGTLRVGYRSNGGGIADANFDELRITKGSARYVSLFSVPTEAFPNH